MKELGSNAAILDEVKKPGKKMLFFSANWCSDCRFIKPAMPEIEKDFSDYEFVAVDRDKNLEVAQEMVFLVFQVLSRLKTVKKSAALLTKIVKQNNKSRISSPA